MSKVTDYIVQKIGLDIGEQVIVMRKAIAITKD